MFFLISNADVRVEAITTFSSNRLISGATSGRNLIRSRAQATAPSGRDCNWTAFCFGRFETGTMAARPTFFSAKIKGDRFCGKSISHQNGLQMLPKCCLDGRNVLAVDLDIVGESANNRGAVKFRIIQTSQDRLSAGA